MNNFLKYMSEIELYYKTLSIKLRDLYREDFVFKKSSIKKCVYLKWKDNPEVTDDTIDSTTKAYFQCFEKNLYLSIIQANPISYANRDDIFANQALQPIPKFTQDYLRQFINWHFILVDKYSFHYTIPVPFIPVFTAFVHAFYEKKIYKAKSLADFLNKMCDIIHQVIYENPYYDSLCKLNEETRKEIYDFSVLSLIFTFHISFYDSVKEIGEIYEKYSLSEELKTDFEEALKTAGSSLYYEFVLTYYANQISKIPSMSHEKMEKDCAHKQTDTPIYLCDWDIAYTIRDKILTKADSRLNIIYSAFEKKDNEPTPDSEDYLNRLKKKIYDLNVTLCRSEQIPVSKRKTLGDNSQIPYDDFLRSLIKEIQNQLNKLMAADQQYGYYDFNIFRDKILDSYLSAFVPIDTKINELLQLINTAIAKQHTDDESKDYKEKIQSEISSLQDLIINSRNEILNTLEDTFSLFHLCYRLTDLYPIQLKKHQEMIISRCEQYNNNIKTQLEQIKQNEVPIGPLSDNLINNLKKKLRPVHKNDAWIQLLSRIAVPQ